LPAGQNAPGVETDGPPNCSFTYWDIAWLFVNAFMFTINSIALYQLTNSSLSSDSHGTVMMRSTSNTLCTTDQPCVED
jgi:hypothetical protein